MIIPGRVALQRKVITQVLSAQHQTQPCGIDLTLRRVKKWSSPGTIDFDNTQRKTAEASDISFEPFSNPGNATAGISISSTGNSPRAFDVSNESTGGYVDLSCGSYLVEFNELVDMPLDLMGQIFVRSSLFRSGALISAGVMDSGYKGAIGAMLQVVNPHGLRLLRDAKLAQMVFHQMSEPVEGYSGVYQGRTSV